MQKTATGEVLATGSTGTGRNVADPAAGDVRKAGVALRRRSNGDGVASSSWRPWLGAPGPGREMIKERAWEGKWEEREMAGRRGRRCDLDDEERGCLGLSSRAPCSVLLLVGGGVSPARAGNAATGARAGVQGIGQEEAACEDEVGGTGEGLLEVVVVGCAREQREHGCWRRRSVLCSWIGR